jgi:hypothetical protein
MVMALIRGLFLWRRRGLIALLAAALLVQQPLLPAQAVAAQEAPPASETSSMPDVGAVLVEDPLTGPGLLLPGRCPTGRNLGEFVGEGYILKVTGRCSDDSDIALAIPSPMRGLVFSDGEVRLEMRPVSGHDRVSFSLYVRAQQGESDLAIIRPARGSAVLGAGRNELNVRSGLQDLLARDDWNTIAVRAQGPNLWLLINDQLIATATNSNRGGGSVFIGLQRLGDVNDQTESAVVVRNLRVSSLAQ